MHAHTLLWVYLCFLFRNARERPVVSAQSSNQICGRRIGHVSRSHFVWLAAPAAQVLLRSEAAAPPPALSHFHFLDANNSSAPLSPSLPMKPISYAPKLQAPSEESAALLIPDARPRCQSPLPRRLQPPMPPREWTQHDMRYVKDAAPWLPAPRPHRRR